MDWRVKASIQLLLSGVAGGSVVNDLLQRTFGGRADTARHVASKIQRDWLVHMAHLAQLGFRIDGRQLVEIGTGWLPVMPFCFALAGAARCTTFDLVRHLRPSAVRLTLAHLEPHMDEIATAAGLARAEVADRWLTWSRAADPLRAAGVDYRAPADATRTGLARASVGLVFSNSVLEHVTPEVLQGIMAETRRILHAEGIALHGVNCGDHFAYFDHSITPIHYLRYTDRQWRRWNSDLLFQNRLRPVDFLDSARVNGLEVILDSHRPRPDLAAMLAELPIAPEFRRYSADDLCSTSLDFAARPRDENAPP